MASRRNRLASFADMMLRDYLERKRMREQSEMIGQRQRELAEFNDILRQQTAEDQRKQRDRELALGDPTGRIAESIGQPNLAPPALNRLSPIMENIGKWQDMGDVQPGEALWGQVRGTTQGDISQSLMRVLAASKAKRDLLSKERPVTGTERYVPETGATETVYTPTNELAGQSFQKSPTTQQSIDTSNLTEKGTRREKVRTAGDTAYATGYGSQKGYMQPDLVDARVEEHNRKARGTAEAGGAEGKSTEGERRAATNFVPLMDAHAVATNLERKGVDLKPGVQITADSPFLNWTNQQLPADMSFSPDSLKYVQVAKNFASTYTYLKSGVQSRPDEYNRYITTLFHSAGDPATVRAQKTATREVFLQAAMIASGRSKFEAGTTLGTAVKTGKVPVEVLNVITFDPEIKAGIDAALGLGPVRPR